MKLLYTSFLVSCALFLNAQIENGCISLDFETFPNETPVSGLVLSDQFEDAFGLTFRLEGGGFPVLAEVGGDPAEAFGSAFGNDTPAPGNDIGQFFLTDDGQLSGLTSPPIILDFEFPIDSFAGCILDMDFQEFFIIQALDEVGNIILEERFDAGDPNTGDGVLTCWGFNLPGCEGSIYSIRYAGFRPASSPGAFGLGMDFFSFCYSGLRIDTEVTSATCNELGSIEIFSTTDEVYEYSLDGINFSLNGFFDQLDAGTQEIFVMDDEGCITSVEVIVELEGDDLPDPIFVDEEICEGEIFILNGQEYTDAGTFQQTLSAANGCDTLLNLTLAVFLNASELVNEEICEGETFELNGQSYTTGGIFEQMLNTSEGCDSIIEINLTVNPNTSEDLSVELCDGEIFELNGQTYDMDGFFTQELSNEFGCDSIINLELIFIGITMETVNAQVCDGETFELNGQSYSMGGSFQQILTNVAGCDSIIDINLDIIENTEETINEEICQGGSFTLNGEVYVDAGIFSQQFPNQFGCDSTLFLRLEVIGESTMETISAQACEGETFQLNGQSYTTGGIFTQSLTNAAGCDSLLTLELEFASPSFEVLDQEICEGSDITINGIVYNTAGSFSQNFINVEGCDSLLNINIILLPTVESCESVTIFEGEIFSVNGETFTVEGTYEQLLQTTNGCDSLLVIKLDVLPMPITLVHYDFNNCAAGGTSYDELIPRFDNEPDCAEIEASIVNRPSGLPHSCTPGESGSGMCVSSDPACTFQEDSKYRLVFDVFINPTSGPLVISGLSFFEKAPFNYEFNVGHTGLNNFPTLYTFKISKNGTDIFMNQSVSTNREWTQQTFDFSSLDDFVFDEAGTLTVEFLAFCPIGVMSNVSAWDIDELSVFGFCEPESNRVTGNVMTTHIEPLSQVEIAVSDGDIRDTYLSDANGEFAFETAYVNTSVIVELHKNDDPLNGVSTLDLILIQRHIMGVNRFDEFTDYVAADINKDNIITAIDLFELRKLILGVYDDIPQNTSWRFLDAVKNYTELSDLEDHMIVTNFDEEINAEGIKVGDVNQTYILNAQESNLDSRSQSNYNLIVKEQRNKNGELVVGFFASEDFNLSGIQATFNVGDTKQAQLVPHKLNIGEHNYHLKKDQLKISWTSQNQEIKKGELLFELFIENSQKVDHIQLDNDSQNEIYQSSDLKAQSLILEFENESIVQYIDDSIKLHVHPNPFTDVTQVQIVSKERLVTTYKIIDATGQLITSRFIQLETGINTININRAEFPGTGVYFIMIHKNERVYMEKVVLY
ncbi:T9SS type A sorting domain-containing protein [Saprospiraceae bacterium]|nr:T9SS type A sorting domain-containing protein [Saprospiraceae bacterium]